LWRGLPIFLIPQAFKSMAQFSFQSKSIDGDEQKGVREAESESQLARDLRREGFVLIKAAPIRLSKNKFNFFAALPVPISLKEKIFFCKNLQVMIAAGLSLPRAVGILSDQTSNKIFSRALYRIRENLIKGNSFSAALSEYPNIFSEFLCSMVKVGEETGTLENVLTIAVLQMEKDYALKSKVKGAMIYPAVILIVMLGIGMLMLVTVVPQLAATFTELKIELPMTTQFIIALGGFMVQYWWIVIICTLALGFAGAQMARTRQGKRFFDNMVLKFPAISSIIINVNSAYTLRNLSALIGAGVSLPRSLVITSNTVGNVNYRNALLNVEGRIKKGEKLSVAIKAYGHLYPATAIQMIAVGEETGETSNILLKLAEFYENEVDEKTKNFASVIEPMLMIVIGAAVGFFAVSMIQPMYSMMDSI